MFTRELKDLYERVLESLIIIANLSYILFPILVGAMIWGWRPTLFEGCCVALCVVAVGVVVYCITEDEV